MSDVNFLAVAVAAVAVFVVSSVWYTIFGKQLSELLGQNAAANSARPPAWKILVELVRSAVVATVLAGAAAQLEVTDWTGALQLGLVAWIGFPAVLLSGAVIWDNVPWKLAAIHAGDWLLKLPLIAVIVSVWP